MITAINNDSRDVTFEACSCSRRYGPEFLHVPACSIFLTFLSSNQLLSHFLCECVSGCVRAANRCNRCSSSAHTMFLDECRKSSEAITSTTVTADCRMGRRRPRASQAPLSSTLPTTSCWLALRRLLRALACNSSTSSSLRTELSIAVSHCSRTAHSMEVFSTLLFSPLSLLPRVTSFALLCEKPGHLAYKSCRDSQ